MFPLAGASVYEHISKNGAVTIAKDPGRDVTHTHTPSLIDMFTNLTPSQYTHLHNAHTFTTLCTITCLPDLHLPTHYLTHSHVHLPHTFTPLTTSLSHSPLTHMFTCLTPSHPHTITHYFPHSLNPHSHVHLPHTITHYFPQSLTPHSHVHLPHTFTPLTTSLSHSTLTHMFTCLTPSHHHSLTKSTHVYTPSHISPRSRSESTEDLLTRRPQKWRDCHLLHTECKRPLVGKNLRGNTVYTHGSTWYFNENQHLSAI